MADNATALPQGTRIQDYTIEGLIGTPGHFGVTYVARDPRGEKVALKEFFPVEIAVRDGEALKLRRAEDAGIFKWGLRGFVDEAQMLVRFQHPNIVRGLAAFEHNATAYLAMEFIGGVSFAEALQKEGRMREVRLRPFLMPVVDGMEQAHAAGLLHRDICPNDIRIAADGRPVLTDFAAARNVLRFKSKSPTLAFTPGFAPVEEYQVAGKQGPWTDVYSLAAVAYRALSGQVPPEATARKLADTLVPAVEAGKGSYPEAFLRAVDWGLRVEPADRPQRIGDWHAALDGEREIPEFNAAPVEVRMASVPAPVAAPEPEIQTAPAAFTMPVGTAPSRGAAPKGLLIGGVVAALVAGGAAFALLGGKDTTAQPDESAVADAQFATDAPAAPVEAAAVPATPAPAHEEMSALDRIALQMLRDEQRKQTEEEAKSKEEERVARETAAREKAAAEQAAIQGKLAEEQDATRRKALEEEQARARLAEEQRLEQAEMARLETEQPAAPPATAIQVAQKRPEDCRVMHVSALSGSGKSLSYADAGRIRGAVIDDVSGVIRLPPMKVDGRNVSFEVQPDGCVTIRR